MNTPRIPLLALALVASGTAWAQTITLSPGFCLETNLTGAPLLSSGEIAARADGTLFQADKGHRFLRIDPNGQVTQLVSGTPPAQTFVATVLGDGSPLLGTDPIAALFYNDLAGGPYQLKVWRVDPLSGATTELASTGVNLPAFTAPGGLALASGGAFGDALYVSSSNLQNPTGLIIGVYRIDTTSGQVSWFSNGVILNSGMAFDRSGDFGGDLFQVNFGGVYRIDPTGTVSTLSAVPAYKALHTIAFGPGGNGFGTDLYALGEEPGSGELRIWRIDPSGQPTLFADGFPYQGIGSYHFQDGALEFSADGSTLYVGIDDTIHEIKLGANVQTYCQAKVDSAGCTPAVSFGGACPSVGAGTPFSVQASGLLNQKPGMMLYGFNAASLPFAGGTKCVAPWKRTPLQNSGGNTGVQDCSGSFSFDLAAVIQAGSNPKLVPGATVYVQFLYRDPLSVATMGLSDAGSFDILP